MAATAGIPRGKAQPGVNLKIQEWDSEKNKWFSAVTDTDKHFGFVQ